MTVVGKLENRDVTKFEFDKCSNFSRFQRIQNLTNVLSDVLSNVNALKNPCSVTDFICTESQRV